MPLDPSIPLSVRPPQLMSLSDVFAQQRAQQAFQTQQQAAQSELVSQGLQQQQGRMAIAGQQAMNEAYSQPGVITTGADGVPTIDPSAISSILAAKGQGHLIPGVSKSLLDMQEAAAKVRESKSKLSSEEADYAGTVGAAAYIPGPNGQKTVDPDLLKVGLSHAAAIYGPNSPSAQALQMLQQDPSKADAIASHLVQGSPKQQGIINAGRTAGAAETRANTGAAEFETRKPLIAAQTAEAQTKVLTEQRQADAALLSTAAKKGPAALQAALAELPYGRAKVFEGQTDPNAILQLGMKPAEISTAGNAAQQRAETERHNKVEERQGAQRVGVEQGNLAVRAVAADPFNQSGVNGHPMQAPPVDQATGQAASGQAYLKTLPASMQDMVKAIAEGRRQPPSNRAQGAGLQLMSAVLQYDPQWSEQRAQVRKNFAPGTKVGNNVAALNTATVHLGQLHEVAEAMNNGSFQPGNQLYNYIATKLGSDKVTNYNYVMNALAGETATAMKGNATDPEIANVAATLSNVASPKQALGVANEGLKVMGAKLNTYNEQYQQAVPGDTAWSPILPSAAAVFQKYGQNPTAPPPANGKPQAAAQQGAPKEGDIAVGPGGARVVLKGNQWVPLPSR